MKTYTPTARSEGNVPIESPDRLVESHISYVEAIAKKILATLPPYVELDDLIGYGLIGLVEASRRFDAGRGVQFKTFAYYRIKGAIYDGIRKMAWFSTAAQPEVAFQAAAHDILADSAAGSAACGWQEDIDSAVTEVQQVVESLAVSRMLSFDAQPFLDPADPAPSVLEDLECASSAAGLRAAVEKLDSKARSVIHAYYFEGLTLEQAGARIGLSKSWTSRIHARALRTLAQLCSDMGVVAA